MYSNRYQVIRTKQHKIIQLIKLAERGSITVAEMERRTDILQAEIKELLYDA